MRPRPLLLEREHALTAIEDTLTSAILGRGAGVLFEGPPGIGKSSLLQAATQRARPRGMRVLKVRAVDVMRGYPFGIVKQLLDSNVQAPTANLGSVNHGAPHADGQARERPRSATSNSMTPPHQLRGGVVTDRWGLSPLTLAVDDLQWCDQASLRWLLFLSQRLHQLPVALMLAARLEEPGADHRLLRKLATEPTLKRATLPALGHGAVRTLISIDYPNPDDAFVRACSALTKGNPFLLRRLLTLAQQQGLGAAASDAARLTHLRLEPVRDALMVRIDRLGGCVLRVVEATAILGDGAHLNEIASLASVDLAQIEAAVDQLTTIDVLDTCKLVAFSQPLVRVAVLQGIPPARKARLHRQAARLLSERGASVERIAAHLLEATPLGDPWVVKGLRDAARNAMRHGAPKDAAPYLERALQEPPQGRYLVEVLLELAEAEAATGEQNGIARIASALESVTDRTLRAELLQRYGWLLYHAGRLHDAYRAFDTGQQLAAPNQPIRAELECARTGVGVLTGHVHADDIASQLAAGGNPRSPDSGSQPELLVQMAAMHVYGAHDYARARTLASTALQNGSMLAAHGVSISYSAAVGVLFWCDAFDTALTELSAALEYVRRGGDLGLEAYVLFLRAQPRLWTGDLTGSAADAGSAVALWRGGWNLKLPMARYWQVLALLELDLPDRAEIALHDADPGWPAVSDAVWNAARGRLALARGDAETAYTALSRTAAVASDVAFLHNSACYPWRPDTIIAASLVGDEAVAHRLAQEELRIARAFGAPRGIGMALRAAAFAARGERRVELLGEAVEALDTSRCYLERCRTLLDLGTHLRRVGRSAAAREPLRRSLNLARQRGLHALEQRAFDELRASGARPRRRDITGPGALTPTERRVAELAATGRTNQEIAQLMFVTRKTVEWHLTHAYVKLGIRGRGGLAEALVTTTMPAATPSSQHDSVLRRS